MPKTELTTEERVDYELLLKLDGWFLTAGQWFSPMWEVFTFEEAVKKAFGKEVAP